MQNEINQSQMNKYCLIPLKCGTYTSQIHRDKKVEWWLPGAGGGRNGGLLFNGYGVSDCKDEKVLKMDSGDGCTTV